MKLKDLYQLIVKKGMESDPRTKRQLQEELAKSKKEYRSLKGADKRCYDLERLKNPYADTRILYGDPDIEIRTIMAGIDMEAPEILAADRLNDRGAAIDLVMAHHPEGPAWAGFYDVMHMQVATLARMGIPSEMARELLKERIEEVRRSVSPANHSRSVDVARLLDIPYMCAHTPADNHVVEYLQKLFDARRPKKLDNVLTLLKAIPEYIDAMRKNAGPRLLAGDPKKDAGKIFVDMTGGTEGPKRIFGRLSQAGVGTIIAMHLSEEHFKNAKEERINIIVAGHIASDTLGMNLLLDKLEKSSPLKIIPCSGFVRVRR